MALKFPYRKVFYHKLLRPLRLWAVLNDLDERITTLENKPDEYHEIVDS